MRGAPASARLAAEADATRPLSPAMAARCFSVSRAPGRPKSIAWLFAVENTLKPRRDQIPHAVGMGAKAEAFRVGLEVVAVGDDGFEIGEDDVAVDLGGDRRARLAPVDARAVLAGETGIDRLEAAVEAGVAGQRDR